MNPRDFEKLVRDCHAEVYRSALLVVGHEHDAADLVQDLYLDVARGSLSVQEADSACGLLRWLVVRRALMLKRASSRRITREKEMLSRPTEVEEPQTEIMNQEQTTLLWTEVLALPDDLRRPFVLRWREEMTLSRIAEILSLPIQTVHDRLQRAQGRLRQRLAGSGLAAFALSDCRGAGPGPAIPVGLEAKLLASGKKLAALLVVKVAAVVMIAVAATLGVREIISDEASPARLERSEAELSRSFEPRRHSATGLPLAVAGDDEGTDASLGDRESSALEDSSRPTEALATAPPAEALVIGRVLDQEGRPVVAALVQVTSHEHVFKDPRYRYQQRAGFDGRFRIPVHSEVDEPRAYRLRIRLENYDSVYLSKLEVVANETYDCEDQILKRQGESFDAALDLEVCGAAGAPLSGLKVELLPRDSDSEVAGAIGFTNAAGMLRLVATRTGPQQLRLDGRALGYESRLIEVDVPASGLAQRKVVLAEGRSLRVAAVDPEGNAARGLNLILIDPRDPQQWIAAEPEADGYHFPNLASVPHRLMNRDGHWSTFQRDDVHPASESLRLVVKRKEDRRDVGNHRAEIHFRLLDATRATVLDPQTAEIDLIQLRPGEKDEVLRDRAPWLAPGLIVQRRQLALEQPRSEGEATWHQIDGLDSGDYLVVIRHPDCAPRVLGPVILAATEIRVLDSVQLQPERLLFGQVLDADGQALAGVMVGVGGNGPYSTAEAIRLQGIYAENPASQKVLTAGSVLTGRDGRFQLRGTDPGLKCRVYGLHPKLGIVWSKVIEPGATGSITITMPN